MAGRFNPGQVYRRLTCALALLAGAVSPACQSPDMQEIALRHALQFDTVTEPLPMRILHRPPANSGDTLRFYLDGDGTPWRNGRPADNPTGSRLPLGLRLFLRDPDAHAYIGRPCYHFTQALPPDCSTPLWTSHRYSEDVVTALSDQVQWLARHHRGRSVELVGYSGGGTLALLISARVADVTSVVTIAAPLDPPDWAAFHRLLPLTGSLSPLTFPRSAQPDELHLMGEKDAVVPPALAHDYQRHFPGAELRVIDGFTHRCCWEDYWPALLPQADGSGTQGATLTQEPQ